jgi:hypothetical protein
VVHHDGPGSRLMMSTSMSGGACAHTAVERRPGVVWRGGCPRFRRCPY